MMNSELAHRDSRRLVQLRFKPLWLYVDAVREFCGFFARATFDDPIVGQRVGVIVHELIENAIRYGTDEELELRVEREEESMAITVANTTTNDQADRLRQVLTELNAVEPRDAYFRALSQAAHQPQGMSGLGLPRVRYEGAVSLELELQPRRVCMTARGAA
jgi:hypothetical protein